MTRRQSACGLLALAGLALGAAAVADTARTFGGYYTAERLTNARHNADVHDWARARRAAAVNRAEAWVSRSDDELWSMVPGQRLGRCIDVTLDRRNQQAQRVGCLVCGDALFRFGNYPYEPDCAHRPWKLTCPSCGAVFPTNDFGRFYRSALDEHGEFDPARGDRSVLFNPAHPDPQDPLHRFGVDDGSGYVDAAGHPHRFIGYYTWKYWRWIGEGVSALADAFVLTGDHRYAHKAAVLLDRIADLYPSLDWKPYAEQGWFHSDGGRAKGKIEGAIWETNVARSLAEAYDAILSGTGDDPALWTFLAQQGKRYRLPTAKGSRADFVRNVDDRLLRCAFQAVGDGRIQGNEGMHQLTVAACALALNTEPETSRWLDWLFAPEGGAIPGLMLQVLDRDGMSNEGAPGYALFWGEKIADLAARLADYPAYTRHNIFRDFPQFRATFTAAQRLAVLDRALPNLGDSGTTGLVEHSRVNPAFIARGFRYTDDPDLAVAAWRANGRSGLGLGRDLFVRDPDALGHEIARRADMASQRERPAGGDLLTGFGVALLESGTGADGVALVSNYGRTFHHAHLDALNFDLFAFDHWLAPDLGYPEFATAWPSRDEWTVNTISHNTVVIDGEPQRRIWGGHARLFARAGGVRVVQLDATPAYPQATAYRRTLLLIDAPESSGRRAYAIDVFHVAGGHDHVYSFHGPPGTVTTRGLALVSQATGTYAGPQIPFAAAPTSFPKGYSYLYHVERDLRPPGSFSLDWNADRTDGAGPPGGGRHLRLHVLTALADVALADGDPPQNKPGNPRRLRYALLHRHGEALASTFVTVLEPYQGSPAISEVTRLPTEREEQVALEIRFHDGICDRVLYNPAEEALVLADGTRLEGELAHLREENGRPVSATLVHGRVLSKGDWRMDSGSEYVGKVVTMNRELSGGGWIQVDAALPEGDALAGLPVMLATAGERDACYLVHHVRRDGSGSVIDCGPISFVHGFSGPRRPLRAEKLPIDYGRGYEFDFEPGAAFRIPTVATWVVRRPPP